MTTMITARVDSEKRKAAEKVFDEVGLTTSAAVNIFICAVAASGGIPFAVGNQMMAAGMSRWNGNVRTFADRSSSSVVNAFFDVFSVGRSIFFAVFACFCRVKMIIL